MSTVAPTPAQSQPAPEAPPVIPWDELYQEKAAQIWDAMHPDGPDEQHGLHILFVGPTQSGKTTLAFYLTLLRDWVVVLGTKPKDPSLDRYLAAGYLRIDHWPPTKKDRRRGENDLGWRENEGRYIVWPAITRREELHAFRPLFAQVINDVFAEGNWTFVADEGLWLGSREGLKLGPELSGLAYGAASNGVSMYLLMQRPAGIPRIAWSSVMEAEIFHMGVTSDVQEMASLSPYEPLDVKRAIRRLRGYQFLSLPLRGGSEWAVSQVEM